MWTRYEAAFKVSLLQYMLCIQTYNYNIEANKVKFVPRDSLGSVACEHASRKCCLLELAAAAAAALRRRRLASY